MATIHKHGGNCAVTVPVKGNQTVSLSVPLKVNYAALVRLTHGNPGTHGACSGDLALEVAVAMAFAAARAAAVKGRADNPCVSADGSHVTFHWTAQKTGSAVRISLIEIVKGIGSACSNGAAAVNLAKTRGFKDTTADSIKHALSAVAKSLLKASFCTVGPAKFKDAATFSAICQAVKKAASGKSDGVKGFSPRSAGTGAKCAPVVVCKKADYASGVLAAAALGAISQTKSLNCVVGGGEVCFGRAPDFDPTGDITVEDWKKQLDAQNKKISDLLKKAKPAVLAKAFGTLFFPKNADVKKVAAGIAHYCAERGLSAPEVAKMAGTGQLTPQRLAAVAAKAF